jgi:hypothetical protein
MAGRPEISVTRNAIRSAPTSAAVGVQVNVALVNPIHVISILPSGGFGLSMEEISWPPSGSVALTL